MTFRGEDHGVARSRSGRHDYSSLVRPLAIGTVAAVLLLAFAHLGGEVVEGDTRGFDTLLLHQAHALRSAHPWVAEVMRDLSGLGSTTVLTLFTLITAGFLYIVAARHIAMMVIGAVITGTVMVNLLKALFGRIRPDAAFAEMLAPGLSFPSGHAGISAIVFLTLGALLAGTRVRLVERTFILAMAALMTLLVGISRVALGVHWATDVLAGWAIGAAWAMLWLLLVRAQVRPS
jgi:undecaprenyl-diphosphatase